MTLPYIMKVNVTKMMMKTMNNSMLKIIYPKYHRKSNSSFRSGIVAHTNKNGVATFLDGYSSTTSNGRDLFQIMSTYEGEVICQHVTCTSKQLKYVYDDRFETISFFFGKYSDTEIHINVMGFFIPKFLMWRKIKLTINQYKNQWIIKKPNNVF